MFCASRKAAATLLCSQPGPKCRSRSQAAERLASEGVKAAVVSLPCFELFAAAASGLSQKRASARRRGSASRRRRARAGILCLVRRMPSLACRSFGASAPAGDLFKKFGITVDAIIAAARVSWRNQDDRGSSTAATRGECERRGRRGRREAFAIAGRSFAARRLLNGWNAGTSPAASRNWHSATENNHGPHHTSTAARPRGRAYYGVPAFNINNMEQGLAIVEAAASVDAPVIIQASRGARAYANDIMLAKMIEALIEHLSGHSDLHASGSRQQRSDLPQRRSNMDFRPS